MSAPSRNSATSPKADLWLAACLAGAALLSAVFIFINVLGPRYTGISYFPREFAPLIVLALHFSWFARKLRAQAPRASYLMAEASNYALAMTALAAVVTAIQFTPFPPIDASLLRLDKALGYNGDAVLGWTCAHPLLRRALMACYDSTDLQLILVPMIPLFSGEDKRLRLFILAIIYAFLLGGLFYYFFPSSGPATLSTSPYFLPMQRATFMKFLQVHSRRPVTTMLGGMIAFPSFHVAWSVLLPYAARGQKNIFAGLLALNAVVIASTLLLGWHYLVDVPGGIILALAALGLAKAMQRRFDSR